MNDATGLTRESSDTIGFVLDSYFTWAIDQDELREWTFHVIGQRDASQLPAYVFDLGDTEGTPAAIFRLLGFVPVWDGTDEEREALIGLAIKRGRVREQWPVPPARAAAALRAHPAVEERFRREFPFIAL